MNGILGRSTRLSNRLVLKPQFERLGRILPLTLTGVNRRQKEEPPNAKTKRSANLAHLRKLEADMALVGVLDWPRWRGRKPKKHSLDT